MRLEYELYYQELARYNLNTIQCERSDQIWKIFGDCLGHLRSIPVGVEVDVLLTGLATSAVLCLCSIFFGFLLVSDQFNFILQNLGLQ